MSQSKSSVNVAGDDPGDFDFAAIDLSDLTVDLGETESEYDRLKAQYNNRTYNNNHAHHVSCRLIQIVSYPFCVIKRM